MSDWRKHSVCLIRGSYHTQKGKKSGYSTITLGEVFEREPLALSKDKAEAIIPSSYAEADARDLEAQRGCGSFVALVGDIDSGNHDSGEIYSLLDQFFREGIAARVYSTASATSENRKWRFIVPLESPLSYGDWHRFMEVLYAFMQSSGIEMDKKLLSGSQLSYLPNVPPERRIGQLHKGKPTFFDGGPVDGAGATLNSGLAPEWFAKLPPEPTPAGAALSAPLMQFGWKQPDPRIAAFNESHPLGDILVSSGYARSPTGGDNWRSPHQNSDSYATRAYKGEDGAEYWISLSGSDAAAGLGAGTKNGQRHGDAFDLFVHYKHGGDFDAALRALPCPPGVASRYRLMTAKELSKLPPVLWAVRGILPAEGLAAIYGAPGSGKSFMAFDLLASIACGATWFGNKTNKRPVTYVALEGEAGISQRVAAHEARHGALPRTVRFATQPLNLLTPQDIADLSSAINAAGGRGGILCIDTLNRASSGTDENDSKDMGRIISAAKQVQDLIGGLVILVHHSGKDTSKGLRGHSSLHAALDAAIEVSKNAQQHSWRVTKSKDGRDDQSGAFRLEIVSLGLDADSEETTSCVVVPLDGVRLMLKPFSTTTRQAVDSYLAIAPTLGDWQHGRLVGVPLLAWRDEYYRTCTSETDDGRRKAFKRARDDLSRRGDLKVDGALNLLIIPEATALKASMGVLGNAITGVFGRTGGTVPGHVRDTPQDILPDGQGHLS